MSAINSAVVLVVDDQDAGRFVKVQTLRRAGFEVHEAATGQATLTLAVEIRPEVAVLDVNLPDMSGFEVCRRLRQMSDILPAIQILQVSSTAITTADRVRGLEEGADVYLTEPVDGEILVATVRALLRARRAEAALAGALERERQARSVAEEASRLKDEFIATLSHELRTPLNALMGWIWQLRHSTLDEKARGRALDSLERNARVQAQLINDLLDVSRISKGKLHLKMQLIDLRSVVDSALESVREVAALKHLVMEVSGLGACCVVADHARLQQVVTNLLTNAIQFTPEKGRIEILLGHEGDEAVLSVRDTGEGIDEAFLPHVFDQFRQGEGGLSRKHGGLGLGLSVVRQLVELHGGSVDVSSGGHGLGTTFTVKLPRESAGAVPAGEGAGVLTGLHVLIVHPVADDLAGILDASGARSVAVTTQPPDVSGVDRADVVVAAPETAAAAPAGTPLVVIDRPLSAGDLVRRVMHAGAKHAGSARQAL
jgi:signal transduction histidine kinase